MRFGLLLRTRFPHRTRRAETLGAARGVTPWAFGTRRLGPGGKRQRVALRAIFGPLRFPPVGIGPVTAGTICVRAGALGAITLRTIAMGPGALRPITLGTIAIGPGTLRTITLGTIAIGPGTLRTITLGTITLRARAGRARTEGARAITARPAGAIRRFFRAAGA